MSDLLYIEASPHKSRSHTIEVARSFLGAYRGAHPGHVIDEIDLWAAALPPFDADTIDAKFAVVRRQEFSAAQAARREAVRAVSRRFNAADRYVFSVPMWNFGIPYPLKHYIDVVTLVGENWTWSKAAGYGTIFSHKKALLVCASATEHTASGADASDFQKPYLRRWLRFIGITDVHESGVAPTLDEPAAVAARKALATAEAARLAPLF